MHFELPPALLEGWPAIAIESASENPHTKAVPEQLQILFGQKGVSVLLQKGDRLLREGEAVDGVYLVQSGRIREWVRDQDHQRVFTRTVGVGALVGLATVFGRQPCRLNATVMTDSCVAFVSGDCLRDFVKRWPDEALWIVGHLGEQVRHMTLKMGR